MKKKLVMFLLVCSFTSLLVGCGNTEVENLKNISALDAESTVKALNLSASDKESEVYAQVADRKLLDLSTLDSVSNEDIASVSDFMDGVTKQFNGDNSKKKLDDKFVSYLLYEMEKTPYSWGVANQEVRGMDAKSRSIIVDVTYKTSGTAKPIKRDSFLAKGTPNYSQLASARYTHWIETLNAKYAKNKTLADSYPALYDKFVSSYGDPAEIIDSQNSIGLADNLYKHKTLNTYNCMINDDNKSDGATMTVRYVLVPNYVMGVKLGLSCKHMYITDFALDSDPTSGLKVNNNEGNDVINDNIDKLLHSYYTAIDENNHDGLFSLVENYSKWDKHYQDMFDTTYRKNKGYTISLFDINGTKIRCGVTLNRSVRAKGSVMTFPTYTERYLYTLELVNDKLQVVDETLLSSKLSGEPQINSEDAQTSGFKSDITLTNEDKKAVEQVVANLGVVQLSGDYSSEKFGETVDLSLSNSDLASVKTALGSVTGTKKAVWLTDYLQGYSNYASVKTRELYQKEDGTLYEGVATVDLIYKANKWYVYNYNLNALNKLDSTTFSSKNSLCIVNKSVIENFESQVGKVENTSTDQKDVTGIASSNTKATQESKAK